MLGLNIPPALKKRSCATWIRNNLVLLGADNGDVWMTVKFWCNRQQCTQKKNTVTTFSQIMSVHDGYLGGAPIHVRIIVDDDNVQ